MRLLTLLQVHSVGSQPLRMHGALAVDIFAERPFDPKPRLSLAGPTCPRLYALRVDLHALDTTYYGP